MGILKTTQIMYEGAVMNGKILAQRSRLAQMHDRQSG